MDDGTGYDPTDPKHPTYAERMRDRADDQRKRDRENGIPNPLMEAWKAEQRELAAAAGNCKDRARGCIRPAGHDGGCFSVMGARSEADAAEARAFDTLDRMITAIRDAHDQLHGFHEDVERLFMEHAGMDAAAAATALKTLADAQGIDLASAMTFFCWGAQAAVNERARRDG